MSIWTKKELEKLIQAYKDAFLACAGGKSYSLGTRTLTRQDIPEIRNTLNELEKELNALDNKRTSYVVQARLHHKGRR